MEKVGLRAVLEFATCCFRTAAKSTRVLFNVVKLFFRKLRLYWSVFMENHEFTKKRNVKKIAIRCHFRTIKIAVQGILSMSLKSRVPQQAKCLSKETLKKKFMPDVLEEKEFVSQDESDLIAPFARFGFSKY